MSRKKIILLSIIAVLSAVLVIQLGFGSGDAFREMTLPDDTEINRITVSPADGSELQFFMENGSWTVTDQRYPGDQGKITNLVDKISTVKVIDAVSTRSLYERYEVDEANRLTVTARNNDQVVRTLQIGKASATSRQSYLLVDDDSKVLLVSGNYRRDFDKKADDFRDKIVFAVDQQTITDIVLDGVVKDDDGEYTIPVDSLSLTKDTSSGTWLIQGAVVADGPALDQEKVSNYLRNFSSLKATDFSTEAADLSADPLFSVAVTTLDNKYFLHIISKTENGYYVCKSSSSDYPFRLSSYNAEKFMKGLKDLTSE